MTLVTTWLVLAVAAGLEVGGDALARAGLRGRPALLLAAAAVLFAYGVVVNLSRLDFGRLLGIYIAVFFLVSQAVAWAAFGDRMRPSLLVGGALIVAGGVVLTLWR